MTGKQNTDRIPALKAGNWGPAQTKFSLNEKGDCWICLQA